jgi:peptidoglycan-associated lipoprotein
MRQWIVALVIFSMLLLAACGGGTKKSDLPEVDITDVRDETAGETSTSVMAEEDLTRDSAVDFSGDERISEKPISEMTLEEINAAEFLKNIYFEFDKYNLTDEAVLQLETNGRWLMENTSVKVIIEGHCDERGTEEYNLALGERRANSARDFLIRMGVSSDRLMTASYGESRPMDPRHTENAWSLNRRAHFRIYSR